MADKSNKEEVILDFKVDTTDAVKSIGNLTKANKDLREERKNLDLSTKEGKDRIKEINAALDDNNKTIKENSSALEKSRLNVGNYKDSLDKLVPGLGATVDGFLGITKAALAFIATPIGLVIGALGLAISSVIAYFKSSEDAQNKWNKVVAVGSAVLEQLMNFVEDLGGKLVSLFEDPQKSLNDFWKLLKENIYNRIEGLIQLVPKLGEAISLVFEGKFAAAAKVATDAVGKVVTGIDSITDVVVAAGKSIVQFGKDVADAAELGYQNGLKMANLAAKIDADERKLIVERAKTDLEVSKLREKAITEEGDLKRETINQAIELEKKLSDVEVKHAKDKEALAKLELENNGDDKEAKMKVVQAVAEVIKAEAARYQATIKYAKEIEKLDLDEAARKKKIEDDLNKVIKANRDAARKKELEAIGVANQEMDDAAQAAFDKEIQRTKDIEKAKTESINTVKKISAGALDTALGQIDNELAAVKRAENDKLITVQSRYKADQIALDDQLKQGIIDQKTHDEQVKALLTNQTAEEKLIHDGAVKAEFDLKKKAFEANKKNQIVQATIDTVQSALGAFKALVGIPFVGPILAPIAAAAATAFGIARVSQIESSRFDGFKTGGYTGDGNSNDVAGQVHKREFVMPASVVAQYGKEHFQSYMDGSVVANSMTKGMSAPGGSSQAPVYVSWKEFTEYRDRQDVKKAVVTA